MDTLDRYLEAVRKYLPWQGQDDILAELRVNLESQLEEREAELGRPLSREEAAEWLKRLGSPMQMAARYQPQQYLIGPATFPIYWFVLRLALIWTTAAYTIVRLVLIAIGPPSWTEALRAFAALPYVVMTTAAWVTLAFAVFEFVTARYGSHGVAGAYDNWTAGALPALEKALTLDKKRRTYAQAVAEVIFGIGFLVWLLLMPYHPYLLMGPGATYLNLFMFQLTPAWVPFYLCVVALYVVRVGWRCIDLAQGTWRRRQPLQQIVAKALGLIALAALLSGKEWVTLKNPALDQARYGATAATINQVTHMSLVLIGALVALLLVWQIGRLSLEAHRRRAASMR
jgi:hypothetical protein